MKHSESIALLAGALAKAQLQIEPASKNATNPHFRSHYADLASIWDACRGPLNTNGLSIVQFPCDGDVGGIGLCTMIVHSSGEWMSETITVEALKEDPQFLGGVLTYLLETLAAEIPKKEETLFAKDLVVKRTHKSHTRVSYTPERKNFLIDLVLIHKKTIDQVCNFHSVNKSTMTKWISELRSQEAK